LRTNLAVLRIWPLSIALVLTPACLVADPPQYEEPGRTPPFLDLAAAKPFPGEIILVDTTDNLDGTDFVNISIPVRSEDRGDRLFAALHVDYTFPSIVRPQHNELPPSTFEDLTRSITFRWDVPRALKGCHQLTVLVSHASTFSFTESRPKDPKDTAMATWWVNIDPDPTDPYTLSRCPNGGEVER
jgi:hypothetical protein